MNEFTPSTRARIYHLVMAYQARTGIKAVKTWARLYEAYEAQTNRPWRKLAYQNNRSPMDEIIAARQLDGLLELARKQLIETKQGGEHEHGSAVANG